MRRAAPRNLAPTLATRTDDPSSEPGRRVPGAREARPDRGPMVGGCRQALRAVRLAARRRVSRSPPCPPSSVEVPPGSSTDVGCTRSGSSAVRAPPLGFRRTVSSGRGAADEAHAHRNEQRGSGVPLFSRSPTPDLPRLPRTYVPRRRLAGQLDRATEAPVTLLVAPAGAGKTLGVSAWLQGVRGDPTTSRPLARPGARRGDVGARRPHVGRRPSATAARPGRRPGRRATSGRPGRRSRICRRRRCGSSTSG